MPLHLGLDNKIDGGKSGRAIGSTCTGPAGTCTVNGFVDDEFAVAVPGAAVYICATGKCYTVMTDVTGAFFISGIATGTYNLRAGKDLSPNLSFIQVPFSLTVPGENHDFGTLLFNAAFQNPVCP